MQIGCLLNEQPIFYVEKPPTLTQICISLISAFAYRYYCQI
jgi:hypothetical protein